MFKSKGKSLACITSSSILRNRLQSLVTQCQPKSKDISSEKSRWIIPRLSCIWATPRQTGSPDEGSGSLEILCTQRSIRKRCWEHQENKQQQPNDTQKRSQGHWLIPKKFSFPCLVSPLKGFLMSDQRRIQRTWTFPRTLFVSLMCD